MREETKAVLDGALGPWISSKTQAKGKTLPDIGTWLKLKDGNTVKVTKKGTNYVMYHDPVLDKKGSVTIAAWDKTVLSTGAKAPTTGQIKARRGIIAKKGSLKEGVHIDTNSYVASHGGKPGSATAKKRLGEAGKSTPWFFKIGDKEVEIKGSWKEVSKEAMKRAKAAGVNTVKVLP